VLVVHTPTLGRRGLGLGTAAALSALLLVGCLVVLAPHLTSSSELVRMRNALLYQPEPAAPAWTPATWPTDFAVDLKPPMPLFAEVVAERRLKVEGDDGATARAIAGHLLDGGKRRSEPIQANLSRTYRQIVGEGRGYCGDYADVFTVLASAAGLASRSWAFSFDGFGGHGHIFNEYWDRGRQRWVALDVHNNLFFVDEAGEPMGALAIRDALLAQRSIRPHRLRDDVRPGFAHESQLFAFYRRGLPEWYLWWGNAVQTLDQAWLPRLLAPLGRAAEQLGAVAAGVHPRLRVLHDVANAPQRERLERLRWTLVATLLLLPVTLLLVGAWIARRRSWRRVAHGTLDNRIRVAPTTARHAHAAGPRLALPSLLVYSSLFPSDAQPMAGLFIRERLFRLRDRAELVVVSPQPWFPLQAMIRRWVPGYRPPAPRHEVQLGIDVYFPRFLALPGLGRRWDDLSMALCTLPLVWSLARAGRADVLDAHFAHPCGGAPRAVASTAGVDHPARH
jgi:hypothetical protein